MPEDSSRNSSDFLKERPALLTSWYQDTRAFLWNLKSVFFLPHDWLKTGDLSRCVYQPISIDFSRSPLPYVCRRSVPESTIILSCALFRMRKMRQDEQMTGTASHGTLGSSTHHCSRRAPGDCIRSHRQRHGQAEEAAFVVFASISAIWCGRAH